MAGRYDNPIPTRFLAPIDCWKISAQVIIITQMQKKIQLRRDRSTQQMKNEE